MTASLLNVLTAQPSYGPALRQLICELAVTGRLLPQTSTWTEFRLEEIVSVRGGSTPSMARPEYWGGDVPWVSPKDMHAGDIVTSEMFITQEALAKTNLDLIPLGSVLIVGRSGILKRKLPAQVTRVACTINQDIKALTPKSAIESAYLRLWLLGSERAILAEDVKTGTTVQSLVFAKLFARRVRLPSTAEQHRIVAKVNELMALCDQLEAEQADVQAAHTRLVEALLASLTQARDAADFRASWKQLAEHFHTLFTTEASVDALKQTVLQLGIAGRLVPQDEAEEPAEALLTRIATHKADKAAQRRARKSVAVSGQAGASTSIEPPTGWRWTTFGDATICRDGERVPVSQVERESRAKVYDYYGASGVIDKIDRYLFNKPLLLIGEDGANLINRSTPIAFIARGKYWVNNHAHVIDGVSEDLLKYLEIYVNAIDLKPYVTGTAQPKMNQAKLNSIRLALPPEAEQRRIVAKVDELVGLCDRLKLSISEARQHHELLASVLVEDAVA
ncbi:restriction endonuclease subunit S [Inhella crocodyli]|uniref:Restriction endonuclease subunit S n=1 Tax=Inhella crocodyli TaxID=2499851 RepID=A0A3S2URA1_9BURK|nr:restriction endonuclease subunit S [Inhella crocodyli]RVT82447.1 restriction endonuclease subunit S [Inhella crocodyli]